MKASNLKLRRFLAFSILLLLIATLLSHGQNPTYSYFYRVYLKDKGNNVPGNFTASELLSGRAITRRQKAGITVPDISDLPVWSGYLDQITSAGFTLHCTSKWLNTALFKTRSLADINVLLDFPFVSDVKIVKRPGTKSKFTDKLDFITAQPPFPPYDRPMTMVNGGSLHDMGYNGQNILIAILDGGFANADQISSLNDLRTRNGIKATYDFINKTQSVFNAHTHGCAVLSIIAGNLPGYIIGSAPAADFLLLKTEDVQSEFPCEEDFWAAGAEFADSAGADVISSSLGYFNFDDPTLNYKVSDLDGETAFVTKAADMAVLKGIMVVNSAGNERNGTWKRIIFPADGIKVEAAGAVDGNGLISTFSSAGPSSDGRVKPDNVAMGVAVPIQTDLGTITRGDGTSFSCPILSGMAACLLQAVPEALNIDIINVFHSSANKYNSPDSLYGYGLPDMGKALSMLQDKFLKVPEDEIIIFPNPSSGIFEVIFRQPSAGLTLEIFSASGKLIYSQSITGFFGRSLQINELQTREQGLYLVRLTTSTGKFVKKIIKLKK